MPYFTALKEEHLRVLSVMGLFAKIFGTYSERQIKRIEPIAQKIEDLSEEYAAKSDAELRAKTDEFRARYAAGESLDSMLPEAFATVREADKRVDGAGFAGGTMIFSTQTKHESTIPNPNELVERMRINDQGLVKISGDLEVTGNITGTVAKANDSDNLGGIAASAYALKTDIETLEEATTAQIQNIFN